MSTGPILDTTLRIAIELLSKTKKYRSEMTAAQRFYVLYIKVDRLPLLGVTCQLIMCFVDKKDAPGNAFGITVYLMVQYNLADIDEIIEVWYNFK